MCYCKCKYEDYFGECTLPSCKGSFADNEDDLELEDMTKAEYEFMVNNEYRE